MEFTITFGSWMVPTIITIICGVFALLAYRGGGGDWDFFTPLIVMVMIIIIVVSWISWAVGSFL